MLFVVQGCDAVWTRRQIALLTFRKTVTIFSRNIKFSCPECFQTRVQPSLENGRQIGRKVCGKHKPICKENGRNTKRSLALTIRHKLGFFLNLRLFQECNTKFRPSHGFQFIGYHAQSHVPSSFTVFTEMYLADNEFLTFA